MTSPLIAPPALLDDLRGVTLLDVRYRLDGPSGPAEFEAGHMPGAAYVDLDSVLAAPAGPAGRHPLPSDEAFLAGMRSAGVSAARPVVVYDDWNGRAAARCWWLLRHYGHPDVRVLDGGWSTWVALGGTVETGATSPQPGDFDGRPGRLPVIEAAGLAGFAGTIVDARAQQRYRGEVEPVDPVAGHIPGAVNVPTSANLTGTGTFRSADDLVGLYPEGAVVAYCGSGVTACHTLLALATVGREGVLYPGSWSEWVTNPARPVITGPDAGDR